MNRSLNHRAIWILAALAMTIVFASCQTGSTDATDPVPSSERTKVVVTYSIKSSEPFKKADSLTWATPSQSGAGVTPRPLDSNATSRSFAASLQLKTPLKDELLTLSLWSRGIRFLQVDFKAAGATDTLQIVSGSAKVDSLALYLLLGLDSLKATLPQTREGVVTLYGTWILAGDSRVKGFPAGLPVGIAASEAIQAAMVAASKTGKSLVEQAKTWSLGISTDSARILVLELLRSGKINTKDSSSLFPPPPVRVVAPLAVGSGLRAGSTSVGLTGSFAWNEGLGLVVFQGAVTRDGKPDSNLVVYGLPIPTSTDRSAKLDGAASLLAKASAPEGTYVLTVIAQDGAQNKAVSRDTFTVAAKLPDQPQAPRIRLLSPTDKSTLPFETSEITTIWSASTPQGTLQTLMVDGAAAEKVNDSIWQAKVRLEPTGKARTIMAKATNSVGLEAVATLELTRQVDQTGPMLTWIAPVSDLDVENGVTSLTVRIKATDPSGIDTILIAGAKPDSLSASGEYVRKVPLTTVGSPMAIVVRVVDSAKNPSVSSKAITRANPATDVPPKVVLIDPTSKTGTAVPFETKSIIVRWAISDFYGIDSSSVMVNGKLAKPEPDNKWSAVVDLAAGAPTSILLAVKNKNGVSGGDLVTVTRKVDTIPPTAEWIAGARSVGWDSAEVAMVLHASDNDTVGSVSIGGVTATGTNGRYESNVGLAVGDNRIVAIVTDRIGLKDTVTAVVQRYPAMTIERLVPKLRDTVVSSVNASLLAEWSITAAKSVWIDDHLVVGSSGHYRYSVPLSIGKNTIRMKAQDSAGKTMEDSSHVTRLRDSIPPEIHALSGTESKTVGWEVKSISVGWAVTDENTDLQIKIANAIGSGTGSEYKATIPLLVGRNTIIIWAKDKYGNEATDSVVVQRSEDAVAPRIQPASTSRSVSLVWNNRRFQTSWTVSDDDSIRKVTVAGHIVTPVAGVVSIDSTFDFGKFKVVVEVVDKAGNTSRDSVVLQTIVTNGQSNPIGRMPDGKVWMTANMVTPSIVTVGSSTCIDRNCALGQAYTWNSATGINSTCTTPDCGGLVTKPLQGACPGGWHLPDSSEWVNLLNVVAGKTDGVYETSAWDKLKANDTTWFFRYTMAGPHGVPLTTTDYYPGTDNYGFGMKGFTWSGDPTSTAQYIGSGYWLPTYSGSIVNMQNAGRGFTIAIPANGLMPVRCVMD